MREWIVPALLLVYLAAYWAQVRELPIASTFYPYLLGASVVGGLVVVLWQQLRAAHAASASRTRTLPRVDAAAMRAAQLPVLFLATCALYPAALGAFGFTLSTIVLVAVLLRAFGGGTWMRAALVSLALSVAFYLFVDRFLGVPLPRFSYAVLPLGL